MQNVPKLMAAAGRTLADPSFDGNAGDRKLMS